MIARVERMLPLAGQRILHVDHSAANPTCWVREEVATERQDGFDRIADGHVFHRRDELEADGWTTNGTTFERPLNPGGGAA